MKQENHLTKLEIQKKESNYEKQEFELKKLKKENDFLKNKVDRLEL